MYTSCLTYLANLSYVLVMELLQGGTLLDVVVDSQRGFSEMGVLSVMLQVLQCDAECRGVLRCVAVCCSVLQCVAVC